MEKCPRPKTTFREKCPGLLARTNVQEKETAYMDRIRDSPHGQNVSDQ
jgi:hypothetical protein